MSQGPGKRKPHFKSRKGCYQCKQRHTKASPLSTCTLPGSQCTEAMQCNEAHPRCSTCIRLDIRCTWPPVQQSRAPKPSSGPETHVSMVLENRNFGSPDIASSMQHTGETLTLDDMRLLHQWTAKTAFFYGRDATRKDAIVWQLEAVDVAFDHLFLLDGMLALAAIHKAVEKPPEDRRALLTQADAHMSRSLAVYREYLQKPTLETSLPMFILSSILVTYNLASAQVEEHPGDPIDAVLHCFRLLQGVKLVLSPHWAELRKLPIFIAMVSVAIGPELDIVPEDKNVDEVLQLNQLAAQLDEPDRGVCEKAIEDLHTVFVKVQKCSEEANDGAIVMIWPAILTEEYLNLLSARHYVAVIILAHFAILLARRQTLWWMKGWATRILHAALGVVEANPESRKWLDWPASLIQSNDI